MIEVTREVIDIDRVLGAVDDETAGGVVVFIGRVRNHANGKQVQRLEYEGYEAMIVRELEKIRETASARWPVKRMAIVHRLGSLEIGEASVVIAVSCAHRAQAFEACRFAIDTLKKRVPIWKKEFGPDGATWVEGIMPEVQTDEEGLEK